MGEGGDCTTGPHSNSQDSDPPLPLNRGEERKWWCLGWGRRHWICQYQSQM